MIKLSPDVAIACPAVIGCNISNAELLRFAENQFPTPSPLMRMLLRRFENLIYKNDPARGVDFDGREEDEDPTEVKTSNCPCCGSGLIVQEVPNKK